MYTVTLTAGVVFTLGVLVGSIVGAVGLALLAIISTNRKQ